MTILTITVIALGMMTGFNSWFEQIKKTARDILICNSYGCLEFLVIFCLRWNSEGRIND